jgi:DNA-directed RNA polymerase specialized sigma24 family protein
MTTEALRPIDRLAQDWASRRSSAASRDALGALADAEPDVAAIRARDLGELIDALIGTGGTAWRAARGAGERDRAAGIFRAMLRSEGVHPLVSRALVQALVPGLVGVARRLTWGKGGEWDSQGAFFVDAIATAWEVVEEWSGQDRPYAVLDVLSAVRCRLRRRIQRHRAVRRSERLASDDERSAEPAAKDASDAEELARAIERERHRLDPGDAAVLYAHRVFGYSLSELSESSGHTRRFLAARRDRAVDALMA